MIVSTLISRSLFTALVACTLVSCKGKVDVKTEGDTSTASTSTTTPSGSTTTTPSPTNDPHTTTIPSPGDSLAATSPGGGAPCKYITADEVSEIVGAKLEYMATDPKTCTFNPAPGSMTVVTISEMDRGALDMATKGSKEVSGLGDKAWVGPGFAGIVKGDKSIMISIAAAKEGSNSEEMAQKLAEKVAAKM